VQQIPIEQAKEVARDHHRAGRLPIAKEIYRQILNAQPGHYLAMHNLGILLHQCERNQEALEWVTRSIQLSPRASCYTTLGEVYRALGKFDDAANALRKAIELEPRGHVQRNCLGLVYLDQGKLDIAAMEFAAALQLRPDFAEAWSNTAALRSADERFHEAENARRRACSPIPALSPCCGAAASG
jgi:protein O-GlcNAc transferase